MKRLLSILILIVISSPAFAEGGPPLARAGLGLGFAPAGEYSPQIFGKRKKKIKPLGIGVVAGQPTGLGVRAVFQPSRFAVAADVAFRRVRTDQGLKVGATVFKVDGRYYAGGLIGKLLRPYGFGGMTIVRGQFDETARGQSQLNMDAGVGGGIRLGRFSINAEAGLLVPALQPENYTTGVQVFTNVAVLFWPFVIKKEVKKKRK